jgi:hypothetical protein
MAGRALVVGAVVGQVHGVENDVRAVAALLRERGFSVTTLDPRTEATRDAILGSYRALIEAVEPGSDEPVVVYYAGHGGVVVNSRRDDAPLPGLFQCIIPIDYADGSETDFRGITSFELSALQHRLTARTRNVTVIFDCCYSGQMSKGSDDQPRPRSLRAPTQLAMRRHLAELRARYPDLFSQPVTSNPGAVRVMACGEQETAWPIRDAQGEWYGAFTLALLDVLRDTDGAPRAWAAAGRAISARVRSSYPGQRPRIEGPQHRRIFSLDEEPTMAIAIRRTGATFTLDAGTLLGVAVGDVYALVGSADPARELARVEVASVTPLAAVAGLIGGTGPGTAPDDAVAVPRSSARPRRPLHVEAPPDSWPHIEAELATTRRLRTATSGDNPVATLIVTGDGLRLFDRTGSLTPLLTYLELPRALEIADHLAAARDLLELEGAYGIAPRELEIEWGVVEDGVAVALPPHAAVVELDAKIYLRVTNVASRELFVHVVNIGVAGRITLLSSAAVRGMPLAPQQEICFGATPDEELVGLDVRWPPGLPHSAPRLDTLLVIATTRGADLRALDTSLASDAPAPRSPHAAKHGRRSAAAPSSAHDDPYLMMSVTYLIDPALTVPVSSIPR